MKSLTTRQAVLLLIFTMLSTKIQRMPALLSQEFGKNGWLYLIISLIFDTIMVSLILRISFITNGKTLYRTLQIRCGKTIAILYSFIIAIFFFAKILTPFRGTHEFFVGAIFDDLDWEWFCIIFILLVMYMASCGANQIGRAAEIFNIFILIGFIGAMALAVPTARFDRILPIEIFSFKQYSMGSMKLSPWISDFVIILFFIGRVKENKFKTAILTSYIITTLFIVFFCMTFYSIYDNLASYPNVAISAITEFSLLSFNLGRIDWVVVLFAMISSVLSTGLFALIACESFAECTGLPKKWIAFFIGTFIYILDVFVFLNIEMYVNFCFKYYSWFALSVSYFMLIALWLLLEITKNKKIKNIFYPYHIKAKSLQELRIKQWNNLFQKYKYKSPKLTAQRNSILLQKRNAKREQVK